MSIRKLKDKNWTVQKERDLLWEDARMNNELCQTNTGMWFSLIDENDPQCLNLDAEIYELCSNNVQLYIGSTNNPHQRQSQHARQVSTGNNNRLYNHLREVTNWEYKTIEKYPCVYKGQLHKREYELIESLKPWYNTDRKILKECDAGCKRIIEVQYGSRCRICCHVAKQIQDGKLTSLSQRKTGKTICGLCKSYGLIESDIEQYIRCDLGEQYDARDIILHEHSCPFQLVTFERGVECYEHSIVGNLPEDHECNDICDSLFSLMAKFEI